MNRRGRRGRGVCLCKKKENSASSAHSAVDLKPLFRRLRGRWWGGGGHWGWAVGVEFLDGAAVDPEPEERLLRFAVLAEDGVAGRALERLLHVGERLAQLVAVLRMALVDGLLDQAGRVVGVRLEEAGRVAVGAGEIVDELLRRRPVRVGEEHGDEDAALHGARDAGVLADQLTRIPQP